MTNESDRDDIFRIRDDRVANDAGLESIGSKDSRHLRWAKVFASLVAFYQQRNELRISDLIAGIYICNFERIVRFWPYPDLLEDFVAAECGWSEPRWLTLQRWDHEMHNARRHTRNSKDVQFIDQPFYPSAEWRSLFELGAQLTSLRINDLDRTLAFLTPEVMLLACVRAQGIPFAELFRASGVLVDELERAVSKAATDPDRLRF